MRGHIKDEKETDRNGEGGDNGDAGAWKMLQGTGWQ